MVGKTWHSYRLLKAVYLVRADIQRFLLRSFTYIRVSSYILLQQQRDLWAAFRSDSIWRR